MDVVSGRSGVGGGVAVANGQREAVARMVREYRDALVASMAQDTKEWQCYVIYGALPDNAPWWMRWFDRAIGGYRRYRLYVGVSGQRPKLLRITQHAAKKSWADLVTEIEILPRKYATEAEARAVEDRLIAELKPLDNKAGNVANRMALHEAQRRVPRYVRQRRIRFAATSAIFLVCLLAAEALAPDTVPAWTLVLGAASVALGLRLGRWVLRLRPRRPSHRPYPARR